jgi:hypothetical protein
MAAHEAASAGILTSSLVLIAFVAMFIIFGNKDKNDRYEAETSAMGDLGEGKSSTKRHKKHRKSKRKSFKRR